MCGEEVNRFLLWQPEHGDGNGFSLPIRAAFVFSFTQYR
jgi:hypothetical protein